LNYIIGINAFPVGVTPVTSVPTRLIYEDDSQLAVWFASGEIKRFELRDIAQFVSEQRNPANEKGVTRIVAAVP
jgi:hypothetical protein